MTTHHIEGVLARCRLRYRVAFPGALLAGSLLAGAAIAEPTVGGNASDDALVQQVKTEVLKDLQQGDWLSEQVERGIERYVKRLQAEQAATLAEQARRADEKGKLIRPVRPGRDHIRGNPDAEISLVEFSDLECPYCRQFHRTGSEIVATFGGKVNWVFRHFPLAIHEPSAERHAQAAECAFTLGGDESFWKYVDAVFTRSAGVEVSGKTALPSAKQLGVDSRAFQRCVRAPRASPRIGEDVAEGEQMGISGTPTTVMLNNRTGDVRLLVGVPKPEDLKLKVSELLAPAANPRPELLLPPSAPHDRRNR